MLDVFNINWFWDVSNLHGFIQMIAELEHQIQILRDELVQANALRKQQLMELGLLREDEKQKMEREQDMTVCIIIIIIIILASHWLFYWILLIYGIWFSETRVQ